MRYCHHDNFRLALFLDPAETCHRFINFIYESLAINIEYSRLIQKVAKQHSTKRN